MKNQIKIKDSFIIYRSFIDAIKSLPDVERLQIFDAISDYALDGKEAVLSGISYTVFTLIKPQLDANRKRFENGCKDKKKSKPEAKPKRTRSKPEANDNVNDNPNPNLNLESEFELFWQSYKPIHTSKGNKEKSKTLFLKALKTTPLESIKNGLAEYMSHCHSKNSYTKSVEVWLKNQCWNDENSLTPTQDNGLLCQEINKLIGNQLIIKIEASGKNALINTTSEGWKEITALDSDIKQTIKKKLFAKLGTTEIQPKY
jgi:hypothetical protein